MTKGILASVLLAAVALAGCERSSAVETHDRAADAGAAETALPLVATAEAEPASEAQPAVTDNRRETVDAKIERLYRRNGADFGARSPEDFMAKVRAFTATPPRDAETAKRPNGDTLIYQASTNTFAVVARDGTPRTMFKPDDGPAYWAEQKERAPTFGRRNNSGGG